MFIYDSIHLQQNSNTFVFIAIFLKTPFKIFELPVSVTAL